MHSGLPARTPSSRDLEILSAQTRLLCANSEVAVAVTFVAATILGALQWRVVSHPAVLGWWLFMMLVALARYAGAKACTRATSGEAGILKWRAWFALGAGLAGIGWGAAGVLLYPAAHLTHQVFLVFVLGGMMLGAASLLAPRPEAFYAFLIPAGCIPSIRLLLHGDDTHLAMGLLSVIFTAATVVTTRRIHQTIDSSLRLQFENHDLVEELRAANRETEILNQQLEQRVRERTAELNASNEQLRAEIVQRESVEGELFRARRLESLGVLAGGIAHDFNNFLTAILGNLELARSELAPDEGVRKLLDASVAACHRAAFLSSQLLTFAKGGAPVRRRASIAEVVLDAVQLARAGSTESYSVEIAPDLRLAEVDPTQIGQVLQNMLLNARQAMPAGGIIEVRAENVTVAGDIEGAPWVRVTIRDYGSGISADVLPRIFDPYFTTKPGSSGLGLATAYAIVAKHAGRISVESKPGAGTEFTIDLPATLEGPESAPPAAQTPAALPAHTGPARLLVMDDEESLRNLLKAWLTKLGYEVQTARDGAEAIALYEQGRAEGMPFDAVLLDVTVKGGMGGVEAAAKLKELDPAAKLIVSSGYSDAAVMSNFARYGFVGGIPKPWAVGDLKDLFARVLSAQPERKRN